ncbi:patatin-like phospholipase family protein [Luedemannella helvata]|uniref:patatin-like phospholipase family protein n=1 Tax=Luedemannella helvata TaxID=349315 RepID=UPI0031D21FCD
MLAGGAARGAYESGVIDFLVQQNIVIAAFAGTSIGALNAAVLASSPDMRDGAAAIAELWATFAARVGDPRHGDGEAAETTGDQMRNLPHRLKAIVGNIDFLENLVAEHVRPAHIRRAQPIWVAAYPMIPSGLLPETIRHAVEWMRYVAGNRSRMLRLTDLDDDEMCQAVLASAALPFIMPARTVKGKRYRDGWIGRDNVPIRALADDEGCELIIVVHLSSGNRFRDTKRPELVRIDIEPSEPINPPGPIGWLSGLLDISPKRVARLRQLGYRDAATAFAETLRPAATLHGLRDSEAAMLEALRWLRETKPHE